MTQFQIIKCKYGQYVLGAIPVKDLVRLMRSWQEEDGFDLLAPDVAMAKGASIAVSNAASIEQWRAEITVEAAATAGGDPLVEWECGVDQGAAARVMFGFFSEKKTDIYGRLFESSSTPTDVESFARCYRLLEKFPDWKQKLPQLGQIPQWTSTVEQWETLSYLWENNKLDSLDILLKGGRA